MPRSSTMSSGTLEMDSMYCLRVPSSVEPRRLLRAGCESRDKALCSLRNRNLVITEAIESGLPRIWADERAVRQVTLNLLTNAIKFTPQGGSIVIKVGWTRTGGQMSLDSRHRRPASRPTKSRSCSRPSAAARRAEERGGRNRPRAADRQGAGRTARRRVPAELDAAPRDRGHRHIRPSASWTRCRRSIPNPLPRRRRNATASPPPTFKSVARGVRLADGRAAQARPVLSARRVRARYGRNPENCSDPGRRCCRLQPARRGGRRPNVVAAAGTAQ